MTLLIHTKKPSIQYSLLPCLVAEPTTYKALGCFKDDKSSPAIGGKKAHLRELRGKRIQKCYEIALNAGNSHFALQDEVSGHKCWTHPSAGATYAKYGRTSGCIWGYGGRGKMDVYEIVKKGERGKKSNVDFNSLKSYELFAYSDQSDQINVKYSWAFRYFYYIY